MDHEEARGDQPDHHRLAGHLLFACSHQPVFSVNRYTDVYPCRYAVANKLFADITLRTSELFVRHTEHSLPGWVGYRSLFPAGTQFLRLPTCLPEGRRLSNTVEGHVPKGVEVQVLSSASCWEHGCSEKVTMCRWVAPFGAWFLLCHH